jgi:hypothetical protein
MILRREPGIAAASWPWCSGGNTKSSRPAITRVGTLISRRRSITVQPFISWPKPKISACGRAFERRSAKMVRIALGQLV